MPTWQQLLDWVNNPNRTRADLRQACHALGLNANGTINELRTRLQQHVQTQPNQAEQATWAPPGWQPAQAPPTPPAPPVPPVQQQQVVMQQPWQGWALAGIGALAGILLLVLLWTAFVQPAWARGGQPVTPTVTATPVPAQPSPTTAPVQPTAVPAKPTSGGQPATSGITWGPAGPAPQNVQDAARILQADAAFLTVLYPRPGDTTVIGWVIGSSGTESIGKILTAGNIPNSTCVDFDSGASTVSGSVSRSQDFLPTWRRVLMSSQGSFSGLKATVYWTPCQFTSQPAVQAPAPVINPQAQSQPAQQAQPAQNACLTPSTIGSTVGGTGWKVMPGTNNEGLKYGPGASPVNMTGPPSGRVDVNTGGSIRAGQNAAGVTEASYWCNG